MSVESLDTFQRTENMFTIPGTCATRICNNAILKLYACHLKSSYFRQKHGFNQITLLVMFYRWLRAKPVFRSRHSSGRLRKRICVTTPAVWQLDLISDRTLRMRTISVTHDVSRCVQYVCKYIRWDYKSHLSDPKLYFLFAPKFDFFNKCPIRLENPQYACTRITLKALTKPGPFSPFHPHPHPHPHGHVKSNRRRRRRRYLLK